MRGFDGKVHAEPAIRFLCEAGIPTGVNVVLTSASLPSLLATCDHVAAIGAGEIQLLRYKPAGRRLRGLRRAPPHARSGRAALAADHRDRREKSLRVRIDCAMVALLSTSLLAAVKDAPAALAALGVFGCEAARHLGAMRVDGTLAGCSFFSLAAPERPVALRRSAGDVAGAWDDGPDLAAIRAYHAAAGAPCTTCPLFAVCRGGCQIVSRRDGPFAPTPSARASSRTAPEEPHEPR